MINLALFLAFKLENSEKQKLKYPLDILKRNSACDEYEDISAFHITLKKISDDDTTHDEVINILNTWHDLYARGPITVYADKLCRFENNPNNTVDWIGMSQTLPLYRIKSEIEKVAKELKYNMCEDNFPYTPHITCGFNVKYIDNFDKNFIPIPIEIRSIVLWAYDHMLRNVHIASTMYEVLI